MWYLAFLVSTDHHTYYWSNSLFSRKAEVISSTFALQRMIGLAKKWWNQSRKITFDCRITVSVYHFYVEMFWSSCSTNHGLNWAIRNRIIYFCARMFRGKHFHQIIPYSSCLELCVLVLMLQLSFLMKYMTRYSCSSIKAVKMWRLPFYVRNDCVKELLDISTT